MIDTVMGISVLMSVKTRFVGDAMPIHVIGEKRRALNWKGSGNQMSGVVIDFSPLQPTTYLYPPFTTH